MGISEAKARKSGEFHDQTDDENPKGLQAKIDKLMTRAVRMMSVTFEELGS